MSRLFRTYWNLVYLLEGAWRVLMKKKWGGNRRKSFYSEMWGNAVRGLRRVWGLWKSHGTLHVWRSDRNCWYICPNIWCMLDWILSQNCWNTLRLHKVDQLARSAKTYTLLCPTNSLQPTSMPLLIRSKKIKIHVWL